MEKSPKKFYWAVYCGKRIDFEGSFSACWEWFITRYSDKTLGELYVSQIRIARKA